MTSFLMGHMNCLEETSKNTKCQKVLFTKLLKGSSNLNERFYLQEEMSCKEADSM